MKKLLWILCVVSALGACQANKMPMDESRKQTVGTVQKNISPGMSQGDVAAALGSPNIVTNDAQGNETWVYDKISTETAYKQGDTFFFVRRVGRVSTTQKTLTVVIKFDGQNQVENVRYHSSTF
ncbi:MAG: outer membrane protein assembly factor BamE [Bdellovibrionales bacterium]|nr:outer membrane protein assembly factor BamE [Bdellovibrionales bacterium]